MINIIEKLNEVGLLVKSVKFNGRWQRSSTRDKPKKKNGSYICSDTICSWINWGLDQSGWFFVEDIKPFTPAEKSEYILKMQEAEIQQLKFEEEDRKNRLELVNKSFNQLTKKSITHPYLERKKSKMMLDYKIDFQDRLVIPMYNMSNQLVGYQYISDNGDKMFKSGSLCKSAFYPFKPESCEIKDLDLIFLCEGVMTGYSIYHALNEEFDSVNYGVLCCFSSGNVENIEKSIYSVIGNKSIIAIKDNDISGIKVKTKGFTVSFDKGGDANDVHVNYGLECLTTIIKTKLSEFKK